jgi:uncharacterized protein (DUF427 family)
MNDYPVAIVPVNHVEPVPRRIRAYLGGHKVLDTTRALYVWEWPNYPQYYIPLADVRRELLVPEGHTQRTGRGVAELHGLRVPGSGEVHRPRAARLITEPAVDGLHGTVRFEWGALDAWFEEDEQVFVHPRSPYVRVDALRSNRPVRVELDGVVLAAPQLGHHGVGLLEGEPPGEAGHRQHAAAAGQEDHLIGQAGPQIRVPFGDRDLLAQHGLLPGGHGGHHPLVVGALHAPANCPADELRGRLHHDARHGVLDGVAAAAVRAAG